MSQSAVQPTKIRWKLLVIIYFACLVAYLDRTNLSVCATYIMKDLDFDRVSLGYTMSAFFLGYTIFQIPGSLFSDRVGVRITIALALAWWSLFTIFTPLAGGFLSFMLIRFCFGMGEAPLFPGISAFFTRWFSFKEKALANSGMLMGVFFAPAIGPIIVVKIVENFGWRWAFYSFGIAGLLAALAWYWFARETPQTHPAVNQGEIDAINLGRNEAQIAKLAKKEKAPWGMFLRSRQFWAIGIQYSIANYIMYLFLSWIPLYLMEARQMSFQRMGFAAAAPWLCLTAAVFFGGILSDKMVAAGMSKLKSRTSLAICGFAVCMFGLYMGANAESQASNMIWLSISLGALGTAYIASWAGCQDLGAKFGGSVSAWMNTWGNLSGAAAPVVTAYLVNAFGWQGALTATSGFIFIGCIAWLFVRPDKPLVES
ncbi:MAG: MFS transporter [Deltaproteobacteria bacterium]|jgi:ACS family glucarate transporter-like MFS transporter|nr:MFS transporter [Deltaproteobacteria bacterium]